MDIRAYGIEELELSVRAYNFCKRNDVHTIGDLLDLTIADVNTWVAGMGDGRLGLRAFMQLAEAQDYARTLTT